MRENSARGFARIDESRNAEKRDCNFPSSGTSVLAGFAELKMRKGAEMLPWLFVDKSSLRLGPAWVLGSYVSVASR